MSATTVSLWSEESGQRENWDDDGDNGDDVLGGRCVDGMCR